MWREVERTIGVDGKQSDKVVRELKEGDVVKREFPLIHQRVVVINGDQVLYDSTLIILGQNFQLPREPIVVSKHSIPLNLLHDFEDDGTIIEWYPEPVIPATASQTPSPSESKAQPSQYDRSRQLVKSPSQRDLAAAANARRYPILPPYLQVKPSIPEYLDPHPPEYYTGDQGSNYPYLQPVFRTHPEPPGQEIHPPGYHTGGPGPNLPPALRVPRGPFGR